MIVRLAGLVGVCAVGGALSSMVYGHDALSTAVVCAGAGLLAGIFFEILRAVSE